ncbi:MAG: histidine--tRNA ligase [Desulfobulbaceae bacterium]|uniref:Histidine--tRNA ligase n=1 Tax=Candidatus Desulfobia pelagia TaxID=2841692 RepID=A0A8J6NF31_9BACT|nr:histidine--tRNA ligase [Candidatus Desulfobia pelagia]
MAVKALKGFKDIIPGEVETWQFIEQTARSIFHRFTFSEIKVPVLEKTKLFTRSIGETTDIVEKEMYTFPDRNGSSLTMRPEGTAPVLRAYIENGLHAVKPVQKLYTIGPMFRHERPQKGRLRQFHQMSVEVLGEDNPLLDAEVMAMAWQIMKELGLTASLEINSLGCKECRPDFNRALLDFLDKANGLCDDCVRRRETNPLRVLDCKSSNCQEQYVQAPSILDFLCGGCDEHFKAVKNGLDMLSVPYKVNSFMVRGLDYYTRTTFELVTSDLGAQSAVGAGGRYDGLVKQLGGPDVPGIGFAMGVERLALLLDQLGKGVHSNGIDLFIAALGPEAQKKAFVLMNVLRGKGLSVSMDLMDRSLKNQMKQAGKAEASYVLIVGEQELANGEAVLRNMETHDQHQIAIKEAVKMWHEDLATFFATETTK